jgi:hypothetical protein
MTKQEESRQAALADYIADLLLENQFVMFIRIPKKKSEKPKGKILIEHPQRPKQ